MKGLKIFDRLFGVAVTKEEFKRMTETLKKLGLTNLVEVYEYALLSNVEVIKFISNISKSREYGWITGHFIHKQKTIVALSSNIRDIQDDRFTIVQGDSKEKLVVCLNKAYSVKLKMYVDMSILIQVLYDNYSTLLRFWPK